MLMNLEFNTEFFIMMGMFLTITFIITIIIVYFMTKINRLSLFLEQAKEIDESKIERISTLEILLQEEKIYNINIMKQLKYFEKNKEILSKKERDIEGLKENMTLQSQEHMKSFYDQEINLKELTSHHKILNENHNTLIEKYRLLKKRNETLVKENNTFHARLRKTQVQLDEQQKQNSKKSSVNVSSQNLEEYLSLRQTNLSGMITPLKAQINNFRKRVEVLYSDGSKERAILKQELLSLKELNYQVAQDAIRLTHALRGATQQQTLWGDVILEKLLVSSGLHKGVEYSIEASLNNDVLLHLPDKRDLIIDAKISLNSYQKFISEEQKEKKEAHLSEHIKSIRTHIKTLSDKNYENILGINTLDFVFIFVPIEGALTIALEKDKSLYDEAFKNQILLVGSTTLLIAMRAIENVWKYDKQNQNAKEIASGAGLLHDQFVTLSNEMAKVSKQFDGLQSNERGNLKRLTKSSQV
jgi:DNA recombination protein RmuC